MEYLMVQKQMMLNHQHETSIVALSIEEGAIRRQLTAAETCAESSNYLKRVDVLIAKQENVMQQINSFAPIKTVQVDSSNDIMVMPSKEGENKKRSAIEVINFNSDANSVYFKLDSSPSSKKVRNNNK